MDDGRKGDGGGGGRGRAGKQVKRAAGAMIAWLSVSENQTFLLAVLVLGMFAGTGLVWTFHAPSLPGDVAGGIIGALTLLTGAVGNHFFKLFNTNGRNGKHDEVVRE